MLELGLTCLAVGAFLAATAGLFVYGAHLYVLLALYRRRALDHRARQRELIAEYRRRTPPEAWPLVTSQIPVYNEADVAARAMRAVAAMEYPPGRHEIQVLDDSTDETATIIDEAAAELRAGGSDVKVLRRSGREGFKAGALAAGLQHAAGEFVAVFDADFVPSPDFLTRAAPLLACDPQLACLQGRWGHLNREQSWLTEAQSLGIDGHFAIEQGARAWNGLLMNFNGTAGVWRRQAIDDPRVGGWQGDTLTEDLDLSYRAQLAGWRIDYCVDLECPAELPGSIDALRGQQHRWAKGSIQTARKLLPGIWKSKLNLAQKLEATLHLTHYAVALFMVILALVALPLATVVDFDRFAGWLWTGWGLIAAGALAPPLVYGYARMSLGQGLAGLGTIPWLMVLGAGMCVNNSIAVLAGLRGRGGVFERTPKSGSVGRRARRSRYRPMHARLWIAEVLLGLYCLVCWGLFISQGRMLFGVFLALYSVGLMVVGLASLPRPGFGRSGTNADLGVDHPRGLGVVQEERRALEM